ncbi:hypothetical protein HHI36_010225 [Cryptolaemus montrouzieri]|uniref:Uncharacterized protein n=1 Tax=Cryptolaemus montrouzieri TaxID=559131 RepID=A0ABD2MI45_9CUCU
MKNTFIKGLGTTDRGEEADDISGNNFGQGSEHDTSQRICETNMGRKTTALTKIMPNCGGVNCRSRKMYSAAANNIGQQLGQELLGERATPERIMRHWIDKPNKWQKGARIISDIMKAKEREDRENQREDRNEEED